MPKYFRLLGVVFLVFYLGNPAVAQRLPTSSPSSKTTEKPITFGLFAGDEFGVSTGFWQSPTEEVEARLLFSFLPKSALLFSVAYHFHFVNLSNNDSLSLPVYIGGRAKFGSLLDGTSGALSGVSIPIGLRIHQANWPATFFIELASGAALVLSSEKPGLLFDFDIGFGLRFSL